MKFDIHLREEDYLAFNRYHIMNSPEGRRAYAGYRGVIPISCIVILAILILLDVGYLPITAGFLAIVCIAWAIMCRRLFERGIDQKAKGKPFSRSRTIIFADGYIVSKGEAGSFSLKYDEVKKIADLEKYLYIYADEVTAIIIPWEFIGERRSEVRKLLKAKTGM